VSCGFFWQGSHLILDLHVQPRASKDEIIGMHGERLKIRITAPPVDGEANRHLTRFLADVFQVPRSQVELLSGASGREKRFRILNPQTLPPPFRDSTRQK
jgi:uncharacterized protein (TIGR00251 family)